MTSFEPPGDADDQEIKSKSQLKREMHGLLALGESLCELAEGQLKTLPLDEDLRGIIDKIRGMPKRDARRRELRYLAKQLRDEADTAAITEALEKIRQGRREQAREFQQLEQLRDLILSDTTSGLQQALSRFPGADRQLLSQLARNHQKEMQHNKPPASSRKLFKYLRELHDSLA